MGLIIAKLRKFGSDENGLAMILVSIMLPVLIGFALLVIDGSRAGNLHNDTQRGADALAIAAAAELDGQADAWTRAERALENLVDNTTRFSEEDDGDANPDTYLLASSGAVTVNAGAAACRSRGTISWCFLKSIPASDATALNPTTGVDGLNVNHKAADAGETQFIMVTVTPQDFTTIFPASFLGGSNSMTIGSTAVAGFTSGVCDFTPVFICNPYEGNPGGITLAQAVADRDLRRRQIELRKVGNGAAAGPGNFGFLEPPQGVGNGAQALAQTIATSRPVGCYSARGVTTKTGQNAGPVQDAFNVRFGIRANGNHFNSTEYGPAANVRKGGVRSNGNPNQCPAYNQLTFNGPGNMGLPRDPSWPYMGGRMGNGAWSFSSYWSTNFGAANYLTDRPGWATQTPTRYEVYRYEIERNPSVVGTASTGGETGTPSPNCQPPVTTVDRRIIYGAILNCNELEQTNDLNGHSENLPVEAFGSFFLTEPVASASEDASVMVELVDITGRGGQGTLDNFLRDEVQLYR